MTATAAGVLRCAFHARACSGRCNVTDGMETVPLNPLILRALSASLPTLVRTLRVPACQGALGMVRTVPPMYAENSYDMSHTAVN